MARPTLFDRPMTAAERKRIQRSKSKCHETLLNVTKPKCHETLEIDFVNHELPHTVRTSVNGRIRIDTVIYLHEYEDKRLDLHWNGQGRKPLWVLALGDDANNYRTRQITEGFFL